LRKLSRRGGDAASHEQNNVFKRMGNGIYDEKNREKQEKGVYNMKTILVLLTAVVFSLCSALPLVSPAEGAGMMKEDKGMPMKEGEMMMEKGEMMMEKGEMMMKEGEMMMKEGEMMKKEGEMMMKKKGEMMMKKKGEMMMEEEPMMK
jgi:hypothetical protein